MFSFGGVFGHGVRPNTLRNSDLARSRMYLRLGLSFLPARLIKTLSIDIADWYALAFRLLLCSEERLREVAIFRGLLERKMSASKSSALLCRITWANQERCLPILRLLNCDDRYPRGIFLVELKGDRTYPYAARRR